MDIWFLTIVLTLSLAGFLIFLSASMSMMTRGSVNLSSIMMTQIIALVLGIGLLFLFSNIYYRFWRKYSIIIFALTIFISLLVFIPGLGITSGGATRWLDLGFASLQPAEFLKLGFVIYCAAWLSGILTKIQKITFGLIPLMIIIAALSIILLLQKDTGSLIIIAVAGSAMFFAAGARWRDMAVLGAVGVAGLVILIKKRPYISERFITHFNTLLGREVDAQVEGFQSGQSLIAVGSGDWFGRGFGQSIQKFSFLPEAATDSIFAVAAEELGFIGASLIVIAFTLLVWRGIVIALRSQDNFARLLVIGIVIMFITQAFIHIAGMIQIFPLSGTPLPFISLGGTALLMCLAASGIVLNVSRYTKSK